MDVRPLTIDPKGDPAGTTRRRMAWTMIFGGLIVLLVSSLVPLAHPTTQSTVAWPAATVVLAGGGAYFLGRAALERIVAEVLKDARQKNL